MTLPAHLWLWIGLGGAAGAICRAAASLLIRGDFPWATLVVNVLGSLLIGLFYGLEAALPGQVPPAARQALAVGFCGAFTTFSTFSYQTLALLQQGQWFAGVANILASVLLCLGGVAAGLRLANIMAGP